MITLLALSVISTPAPGLSGVVTQNNKPVAGAVVFLEGYGNPKPKNAVIEQKNKAFSPKVVVVPVGSTVAFPNRDAVYHNVFAEYNAKKFDLGMYPKGESRSVKFDKPGVVSILCNVHPDMSAFILVVDSSEYVFTDKQGRFSFDVKPAEYKMEVWSRNGMTGQATFDSSKSTPPVTIALSRK